MVDWQGLLNWSTKYHDGTSPSRPDFQPMSKDERDWLEAAMKDYTFNDVDRLKEICEQMHADVQSGFTNESNFEKVYDMIDELQECIEIHERNSLNLSGMGGLNSLLQYILKHPEDKGALNMMPKFVEEKDIKNKEALMGALGSFLRTANFEGKQQFVQQMGGIQFLAALLHDKTYSIRLQKKVLNLLHDLVINDENILEGNKTLVRKTVGEQMQITERILEMLTDESNLENGQYWEFREFSLRTLFRVFQICPEKLTQHLASLENHKKNLQEREKATNDDQKELYQNELILLEKVLNAPNLPIEVNYKKENIPKEAQPEKKAAAAIKM